MTTIFWPDIVMWSTVEKSILIVELTQSLERGQDSLKYIPEVLQAGSGVP